VSGAERRQREGAEELDLVPQLDPVLLMGTAAGLRHEGDRICASVACRMSHNVAADRGVRCYNKSSYPADLFPETRVVADFDRISVRARHNAVSS